MVAQWEASGESAAEFAGRLGVSEKTVRRWSSRLAAQGGEGRGPEMSKIVEVRAAWPPADDRFEVRLPGGRRVGVPASFDGAALQRLLRVLEGAS